MKWSELLVDVAIVVTIISVGGAIVGTLITNVLLEKKDYKKIDNKIGLLNDTTLSGQHGEIQNAVNRTADDIKKWVTGIHGSVDKSASDIQKSVIDRIKPVSDAVCKIQSHLQKEKIAQDWRDKNMDSHQQEIKASFDKMQGFMQSWQAVIAENGKLAAQNQQLTEQNAALTQKSNELTSSGRHLSEQLDDLRNEVGRLQQERGTYRRGPTTAFPPWPNTKTDGYWNRASTGRSGCRN